MAKNSTGEQTPATTATSATPPTYSEAVRRSKKLIQSGLRQEMAPHTNGKFMLRSAGGRMLRRSVGDLIAWAETDAEGFDALRLTIADEMEAGNELPEEVQTWLLQFMRDEISRPKATVGRRGEFWLHFWIYCAVHSRVYEGMKATRNDASAPTSACDAVAEAMAELGLEPATFYGAKRVWQETKKNAKTGIPRT